MENQSRNPLRNPEYIMAFGVVMISVCALVVSIRQTTIMSEQRALMHEQAKASVWPRLSLGVSKGHNVEDGSLKDYQISVTNDGVGPAIIKNVRVLYKGEPKTGWGRLFVSFDLPEGTPTYMTNSSISQTIIRQGEGVRVLSLKNNLQLAEILYANTEHLQFEIYYESIYGDQWKYSTGLNGEGEITEEVLPVVEEFAKEEAFRD